MKKTILISLIIISILMAALPMTALAASDNANNYSDTSGKWFTDAVTAYGYTDIFSDGSGMFNPGKNITRIEFVQLLHKALGISINYFAAPDVHNDFSDMKNSDTGAKALIDLATAGIIERGGSFNPQKTLDREIMIHWIMNAFNYKTGGNYVIIKYMPIPFDDDKNITELYKSDIVKSVILKLVFGRGNNMLFPKEAATRAEAVTIVSRLVTSLGSYKSDVAVTASASVVNGALEMSLTIQNNTAKTITIAHTNGQHYDFRLFNATGSSVYSWAMGKLFTMNTDPTDIKAGDKVVYTNTLDSAAYSAIKDKISSMKAYIIGTSSDFSIDPNGYFGNLILSK